MIPPVGDIPADFSLYAAIFGVFATIFIYSFLWKENPLSRAVEHLFIGLAAVYTLAFMYDAAVSVAFWGSVEEPKMAEGNIIWILPILISLMYFFFFTKKYFYLYRYPVAIVAGIMAGMMICGMIQSNFVAQIQGTVTLPLVGETPEGKPVWGGWPPPGLNSIIIIIGVITVLTFFFFTWEHKGPLGVSTKIGRYFLMATFGAGYGGTVMARISLLIGRLRFLYETSYQDWFWAWYLIPIAIICVIIVALWERSRPKSTPPMTSPAKPTSTEVPPSKPSEEPAAKPAPAKPARKRKSEG